MALIFEGKSECSICEKVLKTNDKIVAWTAFLSKEHKLWKYADSGMHQECYNNWIYKEDFQKLYKYQPLVDFEDPALKERIKNHGMPDWLREIKEYRRRRGEIL